MSKSLSVGDRVKVRGVGDPRVCRVIDAGRVLVDLGPAGIREARFVLAENAWVLVPLVPLDEVPAAGVSA
jgi:hypothetical protein